MKIHGSVPVLRTYFYQIGFYPKKEQIFAGDRLDSIFITSKLCFLNYVICYAQTVFLPSMEARK